MAECIFSSLKAVCIMIADNIFSDGISFVAVNTQKMVKSFVLFGISRNLISWKHIVDICCYENRIDHDIFCRSGMNILPVDFKFCFTGIEILVLDLAFSISVHCIGNFSIKSFKIEMSSTASAFFIRCKCYAQRSVRNLFFLNAFDHCHDLCDSGFVISSENGCAVRSDQCTSFQICQMRKVLRT